MPDTRQIHDVSFELGALSKGLETVLTTLSEDRLSSAQYRTDIRKQLFENAEQMQAIKGQVAGVHEKLTEIIPKVASLEERAMMSKGAATFAIALGKVVHVISALIGGGIVFLLERLFHK